MSTRQRKKGGQNNNNVPNNKNNFGEQQTEQEKKLAQISTEQEEKPTKKHEKTSEKKPEKNHEGKNDLKNENNEKKEKEKEKEEHTLKSRPFYYKLFDPVDNSTLIFFRIFWGLIMLYECFTYIKNDYSKLENYYMRSEFYPKYYSFDWVNAWPGNGMYVHIWCMALFSSFVTIGFLYRFSAFMFFLGFSYLFLIDSCLYLNHFYLICVMAFLLILLPANRDVSVDAYLFPSIRSNVMPRYILYLLRLEQTIVYFYAGLAKINEDWLRAEPLRHWLYSRGMNAVIPETFLTPHFLKFITSEFGAYFLSYGGLIYDLVIGFLLYLPRGFFFYSAVVSSLFFHSMNKIIFNIGIFPYVMVISMTLYFEPNWSRKLLPNLFSRFPSPSDLKPKLTSLSLAEKITMTLLVIFILHQAIMPMRSYVMYENTAWHEMGHRYSWRMKLKDKICEIQVTAQDPLTNKTYLIDFDSHLYGKQSRKIKPRPDEAIQFAHYIGNKYKDSTFQGRTPRVFLDLRCSLNYRQYQNLIRPDIDLMTVDPFDWDRYDEIIVPLKPLTDAEKKGYPWNWNWSWENIKKVLSNPFKPIKL